MDDGAAARIPNGWANGHAAGLPVARPPALEADGLVKRYGRATAVDGIDLRIEHGEVFGFLGPNGAGKTTTIGMVLGLLAPSAGTVRLFGQALKGNERALLRRVGALVEMPTFYPYLGARDNLRAVALATGDVDRDRVERTLALVGLLGAATKPYRTFSLGMKQRLGIGAALLAGPDLVILDEPTNGLDPAGIVEIRTLLRVLAAEGRAVFLSSHQLNEVQQICDRVAIVNAGRIVAEGTVGALLRDQQVLRATVSDLPAALAAAWGLPWVRDATIEGDELVVRGEAPTPFALGEALAEAGVWIGALSRDQGSLERLFLRLTGGLADVPTDGYGANGHRANGAVPRIEETIAVGR